MYTKLRPPTYCTRSYQSQSVYEYFRFLIVKFFSFFDNSFNVIRIQSKILFKLYEGETFKAPVTTFLSLNIKFNTYLNEACDRSSFKNSSPPCSSIIRIYFLSFFFLSLAYPNSSILLWHFEDISVEFSREIFRPSKYLLKYFTQFLGFFKHTGIYATCRENI